MYAATLVVERLDGCALVPVAEINIGTYDRAGVAKESAFRAAFRRNMDDDFLKRYAADIVRYRVRRAY